LRALRHVLRALNFYVNNLSDCSGLLSRSRFVWSIAAQVSESCMYEAFRKRAPQAEWEMSPQSKGSSAIGETEEEAEKKRVMQDRYDCITAVMDREVTEANSRKEQEQILDDLIDNAKEIIASGSGIDDDKPWLIAPVLVAFGAIRWSTGVGTGAHVRDIVEIAMSNVGKTRGLSELAGSGSDRFSPVQEAAHFALKAVASSPNFDNGKAMQYMMDQLDKVQECLKANPDGDVESFATIRDAVAVSLGKTLPEKLLVKVQKLDVEATAAVASEDKGQSAADRVVLALEPIPNRSPEFELQSLGYLLKNITRVSDSTSSSGHRTGIFFAPLLSNNGIAKVKKILEMAKGLDNCSVNKWRTNSRAASLLKVVMTGAVPEDSVVKTFQEELIKEIILAGIPEYFQHLPSEEEINQSATTADVKFHVKNMIRTLETIHKSGACPNFYK